MGREEEKELSVAKKSLFRPPSWFPHPTPNLRVPGESRQHACSRGRVELSRAKGWREQELCVSYTPFTTLVKEAGGEEQESHEQCEEEGQGRIGTEN